MQLRNLRCLYKNSFQGFWNLADGMVKIQCGIIFFQMAKQIIFSNLGKIHQRLFILEFKGKNSLRSGIDGKTHCRKYGRREQGNDGSCLVNGIRLALSLRQFFGNQRICAVAFLATENAVGYVRFRGRIKTSAVMSTVCNDTQEKFIVKRMYIAVFICKYLLSFPVKHS